MAYRRRQGGVGRSSKFKEDIYPPPPEAPHLTSSPSSLAAKAIMASAAHRDSSANMTNSNFNGGPTYDYTSMGSSNEAGSFWGIVARNAKAILDDDKFPYQSEYLSPTTPDVRNYSLKVDQVENPNKLDNPTLRNKLDALTSSMNRLGDTIGNALEIRRRENNQQLMQSPSHTSREDLLKASRDVAMATAAKAKLLLRELKTVKADLAFAKERSCQLEDENKMLREAREKGVNPADDDLIRLQLETLLAEKARLTHENSVYARENRFLREIVEYHQLTMQDVVYLDEGIEEVTQVYPSPTLSRNSSTNNLSPTSSSITDFFSLSTPLPE